MKNIVKPLAMLLTMAAPFAAADSHRNVDYAQVTDVVPIYQTVTRRVPQQECWTETVRVERSRPSSATGTIVGGVIGGAIGNAVGHGRSNKKVGTVVGSILGMSVGHDISQRHNAQYNNASYEDFERCETTYTNETEERLDGYDVTYKYHGQTFHTRTQNHPGKRIKVAVQVRPLED